MSKIVNIFPPLAPDNNQAFVRSAFPAKQFKPQKVHCIQVPSFEVLT